MRGEVQESPRQSRFGRNAQGGVADRGIFGSFLHCVAGGYADFAGRTRRREYWSFALVSALLYGIVLGATMWLDDRFHDVYSDGQYVPVYTLVAIAVLMLLTTVPGLAVTTRRFHDVGLSGWLVLLFAVLSLVGIGSLFIFIIALIPSQRRENAWGPAPEGYAV